jgi:hypothetical protein
MIKTPGSDRDSKSSTGEVPRSGRTSRTSALLAALIAGAACTDGSEDPAPPPESYSLHDPSWTRAPDPRSERESGRKSGGGSGWGSGSGGWGPSEPTHFFGSTVTLERRPPALGGASLVLSANGSLAIATDPDRDRVALADLTTKTVRIVDLTLGDEPGRVTLDDANRAHVVLDRAGAIATIDLTTAAVLARRSVCAAPEGIARRGESLYVACSGGELVTLSTDPGGVPRLVARIDRDLRDIVPVGEDLLVSRLRSAEVLRVRASDGTVLARARRSTGQGDAFAGWRLAPSGTGAVLVHQLGRTEEVHDDYGGPNPCAAPLVTAITAFTPNAEGLAVETRGFFTQAAVPVDVAQVPADGRWVTIAAGNAHTRIPQIQALSSSNIGCTLPPSSDVADMERQAVALAVAPDATLVVLSREPAAIQLRANGSSAWETIDLGGDSREDTGHTIFHVNGGVGVACASCHPGGGDDGRVWTRSTGQRRTQGLQGTIEGTAPYHWGGDIDAIDQFGVSVFSGQMFGPTLLQSEVTALTSYVSHFPAPRAFVPVNPAAAARGKSLFESASLGCASCHAGAKLTNNSSANVGTGEPFQVPSLIGVGLRGPWLHDGRAPTLLDSFGAAGHGDTSGLGATELADLVTYVESL